MLYFVGIFLLHIRLISITRLYMFLTSLCVGRAKTSLSTLPTLFYIFAFFSSDFVYIYLYSLANCVMVYSSLVCDGGIFFVKFC